MILWRPLQRHKEWGRVRDHSMYIIPLIMEADGYCSMGGLQVGLGNDSQGFDGPRPDFNLLFQTSLLQAVAPNESSKVLFPTGKGGR